MCIRDRKTTDAQFIVVSNRNNFFECADRLVGIFKKEDCATALMIEPTKFVPKDQNNNEGHETVFIQE